MPSVDCIGMQTLLWAIQGFCQTAIQASQKNLNISKPTEAIPNWAHSKIPELHVIYFYKYTFFNIFLDTFFLYKIYIKLGM